MASDHVGEVDFLPLGELRPSPIVGVVGAPGSKDLFLLGWRGIPGGPRGPDRLSSWRGSVEPQ